MAQKQCKPAIRYAAVYNDTFSEGATLKEAYELAHGDFDVGFEELTFYEIRPIKVEFQVVEVREPVQVG